MIRVDKNGFVAIACLYINPQHLRDNITGSLNLYLITDTDIFIGDIIFVMERGI